MAIAPIDLQTLFTQVDKVAKTHTSLKDGAIQQAVQGMQLQKKTEELIQQINEAQNTGEGAEKVNDNSPEHGQQGSGKKNLKEKNNDEEAEQPSVLRDPSLGKTIDISL